MIINTGQRTDIPAFYPKWFANRIKEGYVCVRNPYNPTQVSRYQLRPDLVDVIGFCSKNPEPFFPYLDLVKEFGQFWYVTITPYGKDIEPGVPDKEHVLESFKYLSKRVGANSIGWRYDPIFVSEKYTVDFHLSSFDKMARELDGYTNVVVISFIDLYEKVKRIIAPKLKPARKECACYLSGDIGAYDTCAHFCRYCYANNDLDMVARNRKKHDPDSPFLIGGYRPDDVIHDVPQKSWIDGQMNIFDYLK